jgi:transglutaminase-like putative cysteine protease
MRGASTGGQRRARLVAGAALALAALQPVSDARAGSPPPVLHERIPPDPAEDLALHVALDGQLPAGIRTPAGLVPAPDPRAPPSASDRSYGPGQDEDAFVPDRDTRRSDAITYDDPFTPSTAPFKRMEAFDAVRDDGELVVRDPRRSPLTFGAPPGPGEDAFYANIVVDVAPDRDVRIPSVGPGARIVRARLGVGAQDIEFRVMHDGADNWFLRAYGAREPLRARLVMELAIARAAFGGEMNDASWSQMGFVPPLPDAIARDAAEVRAAVGVEPSMRPREAIARLVQYFRGFTDSEQPPQGRRSVYLDLALSRKGVCRHRAYAFLVTAQSLGIPTRFVFNEAHAWVEVNDGAMWKRIDLGGAGRMAATASSPEAEQWVYEPPPDAFPWPENAERGEDMVARARAQAAASGGAGGAAGGAGPASPSTAGAPSPPVASSVADGSWPSAATGSARASSASEHDDRPPSTVTLSVAGADARRGFPLHVQGTVRADGEPCAHVVVEVWLRAVVGKNMVLLGSLATGDDGSYAGGIVVPPATPLGEYDVVARTRGDARCGSGG